MPQQSVTTVAGVLPTAGTGDNVAATSAALIDPIGVAVDKSSNVYIADYLDQRVRKVSRDGIISTVTGNGILVSAETVVLLQTLKSAGHWN